MYARALPLLLSAWLAGQGTDTDKQVQITNEAQIQEFSRSMVRLAKKHQLASMMRYDSRHFIALSNAEEGFTRDQVQRCEIMHALVCEHFRRKGFAVRQPSGKLLLAIFATQAGFEAYLGRQVPPQLTGVYEPHSNRLVMYDYGRNEAFQASKRQAEDTARQIRSQPERMRYRSGVERQANHARADTNLATIMHEVGHQLSFNCGLLNRAGDVPLWLAEGLACYGESASDGAWQGMGEPSPQRLRLLADRFQTKGQLLSLKELLADDQWLLAKNEPGKKLLGYAQSWALFQLLMEERPQQLRDYLRSIYAEKTAERRLAAFEQAFGSDLTRLERRYIEYMKNLVRLHLPGQAPR
jgi:hypothetical protein